MKKIFYNKLSLITIFGLCIALITGCDRENSEDFQVAGFPANGDVFIDGFSGGLEYLPFAGSKLDAFTVDEETFYEGTASMRFDIPNFGDPDGAFAGAVFPDNGGRDLSGFDALTFWAKASKAATLNEIGFGNNFGENRFLVAKNNLRLTTNWVKYTIPLPDPSRLTEERGMFWYSEGPEDGDGYTFWVDELKFEKLGTVAQPRPAILEGEDVEAETFNGSQFVINGLQQTFNLADGTNETVNVAPSYFSFQSSNEAVATVNAAGEVEVLTAGSAEITALLGNNRAAGSLSIVSTGDFTFAPDPTQDPASVLSIFSDTYGNIAGFSPVVFNNSELTVNVLNIDNQNLIQYGNLSFVGVGWNGTSDVSGFSNLQLNVQVTQSFNPSNNLIVELIDNGADNSAGGGDDTGGGYAIPGSQLVEGQWVTITIPLNGFTRATGGGFSGSPNLTNVANVVLVGDGIANVLIDNIFFF